MGGIKLPTPAHRAMRSLTKSTFEVAARGRAGRATRLLALALIGIPLVLAGEHDEKPDLFLLGTVLHDPRCPLAIIQVGESGEQELFRLQDVVAGGELASIRRNSVTLVFADRTVELSLAGGPAGDLPGTAIDGHRVQPLLPRSASGFWLMDRSTLAQLASGEELARQTTARGSDGVIVSEVPRDGVLHRLGLEAGDIIRNINGRVPGTNKTMAGYTPHLDSETRVVRVEVDRQGEVDVLYIEVSP